MLTTGNILMPQMRNPVASSNKPPTALKSAIIDGVVSGNISAAAHASVNWMISNGMLITDTAIPNEQAKIIAAAQAWLQEHPTEKQPRFDVIEVYGEESASVPPRINHLENAFGG